MSTKKKADFGKSEAESGTRPSEQACNERQNLVKDLKRIKGCEPPTIQEADFGKSGAEQDFCHSEQARAEDGRRSRNLFNASAGDSESEKFCLPLAYSESINADENQIKLDRFRIYGARIKQDSTYVPALCSHLSGMTSILKHTGDVTKVSAPLEGEVARSAKGGSTNNVAKNTELLRFARNDGKILAPFSPLSLPSPSRGEGHRKAAFTLAEVLITLGVIGVVAAMTIPGLMTAHKKHVTAAKLKRAVSEINQAIRLSENENGQMENWDKTLPEEEFINTYFRPYIKIMTLCKTNADCGYSSEFPISYMNGTKALYSSLRYKDIGRLPFITMDGVLYAYSINTTGMVDTDNDKMIIIDINGGEKPNQHGRDVFFFYRDEDADSIIPYGSDKSREEVNQSCSKTGDGRYCAVLVKENGWEFPNNYPW